MDTQKEKLISSILLDKYDVYYRLAFGYVRNQADAMDIVQEGAYKAIRKAETLKQEAYAQTWVYRIMLNEVFEFLRTHQMERAQFPEETEGKEDTYENLDLKEAIDRLPDKEKALIIMRFFEDKTLDQIADVMQENLSTVKSRLYRTLGKLKVQLSD